MPALKDTKNQMIQFVFPEHTNNLGTLHGGRLMDWIMLIASITSSKFAKGITFLGAADSIDFINPVRAGEIVVLDCLVEHVGGSSIELGVKVHSENPHTGEKKFTTSSHLAFVAVDNEGKPKQILDKISPIDEEEEELYLEARKRKNARMERMKEEKIAIPASDIEKLRVHLETIRPVLPEDAFYGSFLSVGKLMKNIDEVAAILGARFVRGTMVTGSVDDLYFYNPIRVGEIVIFRAGITYVGKASLEVGIKVCSENLRTGTRKHTCTAYLSFVHIGQDGKPNAIPEFSPNTPEEFRLWQKAEQRKARRSERVQRIKKFADKLL